MSESDGLPNTSTGVGGAPKSALDSINKSGGEQSTGEDKKRSSNGDPDAGDMKTDDTQSYGEKSALGTPKCDQAKDEQKNPYTKNLRGKILQHTRTAWGASPTMFTAVIAVTTVFMWLNARDALRHAIEESRKSGDNISDQLDLAERQVAVSEKLAAATERIATADRAWVFVRFIGLSGQEFVYDRMPHMEATVRFALDNHGDTPAKITAIKTTLYAEQKYVEEGDFPSGYVEIDPDNRKHDVFMNQETVYVRDSANRFFFFDHEYDPDMPFNYREGDLRELIVAGHAASDVLEAKFKFSNAAPVRENDIIRHWWHVEISYQDIYQTERRTCLFARVGHAEYYLPTHLTDHRHNYWN